MSIHSKMTAIADKIRALLGISGTMGLDAMATNLGKEQTNISNAFTAIGNKGGTVPSSKVSGNLASAINSIQAGAAVQTKSGSFTTNTSGEATINCGFQPDIVYLKGVTFSANGESYPISASIAFSLETRSGMPNTYLLQPATGNNNQKLYDIYFERTSAGFWVGVSAYNASWQYSKASRVTFEYIAVKYT